MIFRPRSRIRAVRLVVLGLVKRVHAKGGGSPRTLCETTSAPEVLRMRRRSIALLLSAGLLTLSASAVAGPAAAAGPGGSQLAQIRAATARFHDVDAAIAAGYAPTDECVESPMGGMGYHYVNFGAVLDPALDVTKPEVLLFAPSADGLRLVGVEWLVFDADQQMGTVDHHALLGQTFHGPMTHGLPVHYDLHAWIWQPNANGVFEDWNPAVHC